jgi:transcription elongation factor GreA-like protein
MNIKEGHFVSHEGAMQWGVGKVLAVEKSMVTIRFSDGKDRKIAASHFDSLHFANKDLYVIPPVVIPEKPVRAPRKKK